MICIFGKSYMPSSKEAYYLLDRNKIRLGACMEAGKFILDLLQQTVILFGFCLTLSIVTLSE